MKTLPPIVPTAEQLPLISSNRLGAEVIQGAAGSGKTSTAILRLRSLAYMFEERRRRQADEDPVEMLVLKFNRTLSGYVHELVEEQLRRLQHTEVTVDTFGRWAMSSLGFPSVIDDAERERVLRSFASGLPLADTYVVKEVDYLLGRFEPQDIPQYLTTERTGRGTTPRVDRSLRARILDEVVSPYRTWLDDHGLFDWNDIAVQMANTETHGGYDVAIIDESQDFSANQLRALRHHLAPEFAVTFVVDTVQRIYARGFTWAETGFEVRGASYHTLRANHRNTVEIAAFAAGVLDGIEVEADGSLPDLTRATTHGSLPTVLVGYYNEQVQWVIDNLLAEVDLANETVAFLKPQGGGYFSFLKRALGRSSYDFVEITRESEWPDGPENIALSTFHSAKGLEFDHVVILGLSNQNTVHGEPDVDDQLIVWRRLLAVAVARARKSLTLGYKAGEESDLVGFFRGGTFQEVVL